MKVKVENLLQEINKKELKEDYIFYSRHYGVKACKENLAHLKNMLKRMEEIKALKRKLAKVGVHFQYRYSIYNYTCTIYFKENGAYTKNGKKLKDIIIELKKLINKQEKEIEVLEKEIDIEIK